MQTENGVKIGNIHTLKDWGLIWVDIEISAPEPRIKQIEVPGRNGVLDLTESLAGDVKYANRLIRLSFVLVDRDIGRWHSMDSMMKNYCHGKKMDIVLDSDNTFFWRGRCTVASTKEDQIHSRFVIEVDAEPFKYDRTENNGLWLWDFFNFETGIIREYSDVQVSGSNTITVVGGAIESVPVITVSAPMTVRFKNVNYQLKAGENKVKEIVIMEGYNDLLFTGNGTVTIIYKGASL